MNNEVADLDSAMLVVKVGDFLIVVRKYDICDPIWQLPIEKQQRKVMADAQRDLALAADEATRSPSTVRG